MSSSVSILHPVRLGKNGPLVSQLGLGCMGFSSFYTSNPVSEEEAIATIQHAFKRGINFFDTAHLYGFGVNERLLGKALKDIPRDQVIVGTKFGLLNNNGKLLVDSSPETVLKSCEQSLKDLGMDYIDLYYQHRVDPKTPIEETMKALVQLKNEGKIRHIGLSEASANTIRRAHAVHPVAAFQVEYSLWTQDIETNDILKTCRELGIAIVAYSPLGRGFLTGQIKKPEDLADDDWRKRNPRFQGENFNKNLELVEEINKLSQSKKVTASQIALAWVLSKGNDIIPIPGTRRISYLDENIDSFNVKLTEEESKHLEKILASVSGTRYPEEGMKSVNL